MDILAILMGWPAILGGLILASVGITSKRPSFLVASSLLSVPISLYLAATPRFGWIGLVLPLLYLGAAYCVRRHTGWGAWFMMVPLVLFFTWLAAQLTSQWGTRYPS